MKIKKGDKVMIIAGKDKGREGKILLVDKKSERVVVEGANMIVRHTKPGRANQKGGIIRREAPLHVSNVMYMHQGKPTRLGYTVEVVDRDGVKETTKQRIVKSTGEVID